MAGQRLAVISAFITKQFAEPRQPFGIANHHVPVVMTDLMAEVPQQRAIGLVHRLAMLFPVVAVCLGDVDRDETVVYAR